MLSRDSLSRVLQSLLLLNLKQSRGKKAEWGFSFDLGCVWSDDLLIQGGSPSSLGCDSLEALGLASAVNEMFHLYEAKCETELLAAKTFGGWIDVILTAWQHKVDNVTFTTSGTTGAPKRCTHNLLFLKSEIDFLAGYFSSHTRLIAFTPAHHIYGFLFTGMLADRLDLEVHSVQTDSLVRVAKEIRAGDLVVSIPSRWEALYRTIPSWPRDVTGITSTGPCRGELAESLMERGLGTLVEIYGSSETAGVGLRSWPRQVFTLMPQWRRALLEPIYDSALRHVLGGSYHLQDRLVFQDGGTFTLQGRLDGAVQVGGVNVYPQRVAALLSNRPGVSQAAVRLMRDDEGRRLKALIVMEPGRDERALRRELQSWIDSSLAAVERPRSIAFTTELPNVTIDKEFDW